jgi:hypothetical protein
MSADTKIDPVSDEPGEDYSGLRIQFLSFAACPHAPQALTLLQEVLRSEGIVSEIEMIAVESEAAAQQYGFYGSPSIHFNDEDICPPASTVAPFFGCRLYLQPDGSVAPHPSAEAITQALRRLRQRA